MIDFYLWCIFQLREYRHLKDHSSRQVSSVREQLGKLHRAKQSDEAAAKHYRSLKQGLDEQRKNLVNKVQSLEARVEQLNKYLRSVPITIALLSNGFISVSVYVIFFCSNYMISFS